MKPSTIEPGPSVLVALLGGAMGVIVLAAILHLAPAFGLAFVDAPRLIGGVVTAHPEAAFWLGVTLLVLGGWLALPPLLVGLWPRLPGGEGLEGAALRGLLFGVGVWILSGLLLPMAGWIGRVPDLANPGVLGLAAGTGALGLLLSHLAYGLVVALVVATLDQSISPLDSIGWEGYRRAEHRPAPLHSIPTGLREPPDPRGRPREGDGAEELGEGGARPDDGGRRRVEGRPQRGPRAGAAPPFAER